MMSPPIGRYVIEEPTLNSPHKEQTLNSPHKEQKSNAESSEPSPHRLLQDMSIVSQFEGIPRAKEINKACRICLCEEEEADNPIVQPCNCSGTMSNVHVKCFRTWISKQISHRKSDNLISFTWKKLQCELCGADLHRNISKKCNFD